MDKYILVAYKPDECISFRGCTIETYSSKFVLIETNEVDCIIAGIAECIDDNGYETIELFTADEEEKEGIFVRAKVRAKEIECNRKELEKIKKIERDAEYRQRELERKKAKYLKLKQELGII